jgi:hypothetical protein
MKRFFSFVFAAFAVASSHATEARSWERLPAKAMFPGVWSFPRLPASSVHVIQPEGQASKAYAALSTKSVVEVSCTEAQHLTSSDAVQCKKGVKLFLVRAVSSAGGTDGFSVFHKGTTLYITHGSLGNELFVANTALLLELSFKPASVFTWASGAK